VPPTTFSSKLESNNKLDQFHAMETEQFPKVSTPKQFTASASSTRESVLGRTRVSPLQSSWKQLFSPLAVGLIGLAIAVALWGFGYKLSLYHRHEAPSSRIPVAKLWTEQRSASAVAASRLEANSHLHSVSQAFPAPVQRFPRLDLAVACTLPGCSRGVLYFNPLVPSRSPPPYRFCLA
jgi:hypothetical protein